MSCGASVLSPASGVGGDDEADLHSQKRFSRDAKSRPISNLTSCPALPCDLISTCHDTRIPAYQPLPISPAFTSSEMHHRHHSELCISGSSFSWPWRHEDCRALHVS